MASWIDWPKGAVGGGKHFLCVLMDAPAEALWRLVAEQLSLSQLIRGESSEAGQAFLRGPSLLKRPMISLYLFRYHST